MPCKRPTLPPPALTPRSGGSSPGTPQHLPGLPSSGSRRPDTPSLRICPQPSPELSPAAGLGLRATPLYIPVDALIPYQDQNKWEMKASVLAHRGTAASHPNPTPVTAGKWDQCLVPAATSAPARCACSVSLNKGLEEGLK